MRVKRNDTSTYEKLVHKYNMMELCYNSANEPNVFMLQKLLKKQSCHIMWLPN